MINMSIDIAKLESRLEELKEEKKFCDKEIKSHSQSAQELIDTHEEIIGHQQEIKSHQQSIQELINSNPEIMGHQQSINITIKRANSVQGKIDMLKELLGITKDESAPVVPMPVPAETDVVAEAIKDLEPEQVEEVIEEEPVEEPEQPEE